MNIQTHKELGLRSTIIFLQRLVFKSLDPVKYFEMDPSPTKNNIEIPEGFFTPNHQQLDLMKQNLGSSLFSHGGLWKQ